MSKPLPKNLKFDVAIELLHHREARLMRMFTATGQRWFVLAKKGGPVSDADAAKIIQRTDVRGSHDALFPGIDQTFRIVRD
jgi:hypothetical protein